jgi:hypothetical protein
MQATQDRCRPALWARRQMASPEVISAIRARQLLLQWLYPIGKPPLVSVALEWVVWGSLHPRRGRPNKTEDSPIAAFDIRVLSDQSMLSEHSGQPINVWLDVSSLGNCVSWFTMMSWIGEVDSIVQARMLLGSRT